jgi:[ribosomal protein S18]-alanine N-acetyltransferase
VKSIEHVQIRLARERDAEPIARLSRQAIEYGLPWKWTPARVLNCIHDRETNVVVARDGSRVTGFGIMKYCDEDAHLFLLAVDPMRRRCGIGSTIIAWLERTAVTAGLTFIRVEARSENLAARAFYARLGYRESGCIRGYYQGVEDAVRIEKQLRFCTNL